MSDGEPGRIQIRRCLYRKSDSAIMVMKSAEDGTYAAIMDILVLQIFNSLFYASVALTEIIKPGHSQQSLSGAREVIKRAVFPPEDRAGVLFNTQGADALTI